MKIPKALQWFGFDREYFEKLPHILIGVGILILIILALHFLGFDIFTAPDGKTYIVIPL